MHEAVAKALAMRLSDLNTMLAATEDRVTYVRQDLQETEALLESYRKQKDAIERALIDAGMVE